MGQDKKVRHGKLTFILARGIGEAFIARDVPQTRVSAFLAEELRAPLTFRNRNRARIAPL